MKKKIIYGLLFAVAMVTASSSFVSCKDYEGDDYALLKEKNASLEDLLAQQQTALTQLQGIVNGLQIPDPCNCKDWTQTIQGLQNQINDALNPNKEGSIQDQVNDLSSTISGIQTQLQGLAVTGGLTQEDSIKIINRLNDFDKFWKIYGSTLNEAMENAKKAYITLISDSTLWNETAKTVKDSSMYWSEAYKIVKENAENWTSTYEKVRDSSMYWSEAYDSIKARADVWNQAVIISQMAYDFIKDSKYETIGEFEKAFEDAVDELQGQIDDLRTDVDNILGTLKKQITSIEIQGTYNPVFGTFGFPASIQSNVLAAFYGTAEDNVKFPAYQKRYYVNDESWITKAEWDAIGLDNVFEASAGDPLIAEEGNAGTLYVTVNPSNVDFEGTTFSMRSSDNKVSKMQLSPLEPSEKVLTFGYTRANSANGFYEMQATVDVSDAAALAPKFNIKSVGSSVVQVMKDVKNTAVTAKNTRELVGVRSIVKDLAEVVAKVYANSADILPRLGIQANWNDPVTGPKSVTSKYEIAATAIKPLGFGTLSKYWSLNNISYTPNHTFIKYIDGQAIDKEIYDIIMENLKLELNLQLNDLHFDKMYVGMDPQSDVIFQVPVNGYNLTTSTYWFKTNEVADEYYWANWETGYWNYRTGYRMELIACDDDGNILYNPDGTPKTTGIYALAGTIGSDDYRLNLDKWEYIDEETNGRIYKFPSLYSDDYIILDLTDFANTLLYGEFTKDTETGEWIHVDLNGDGVINTGIYGTLNEQLNNFNKEIDNINGMPSTIANQVNDAVEEAMTKMGTNIYESLSDFVLGYVNRANTWIERLNRYGNKALDYLINDPDRYVQPMLFSYDSNHKLTMVGRTRFSPSVANAGDLIALQPTTMTLETIAPAFKKHVAISNVYNNKTGKNAVYDNDAAAKAVMAAANEAIGAKEVIDGGTQEGIHTLKTFTVPANASGMTLEIVYTALGYDGIIAGKKFYIRVK